MRGHETPENYPLTILKGFSTASEEITITLYNVWKVKFWLSRIRTRKRAFHVLPFML
jgi:hypothetical protein